MTRKTKIRNAALASFIIVLLAFSGIVKADVPPGVETVIEYNAENEYQLKIGWDEPIETDIAFYVVWWREYGDTTFEETWFELVEVQTGPDSTWSVARDFQLEAAEGDTTYYEFRVLAADNFNNISDPSYPAYIGLFAPDMTPPRQITGLFLRLVIVPKVN